MSQGWKQSARRTQWLVSIIAGLVSLSMGLARPALAAGPQERVGEILAAVSAVMHDPQLKIFQPYEPLQGEDLQPQRPQVTEIPPVKPVITEYQVHQLVCSACGEATRAEVPPGVSTGGFGPRGQAILALCTGASHLSQRTTHTVREDLFGVSLGLGTMANLEPVTTQAVAAPVAEARAAVQAQPAASVDETGWREGQQRAWLWTVVTAWGRVFAVRLSRSRQVAHELLGARVWGWVVTERWRASSWYPPWRRQRGWAHLGRDMEAMVARGGPSQVIGEAWQAQVHQLVHWWPRGRAGTLAPASFAHDMRPIRREIERRLEAGQPCGVPKTAGTC